MHKAVIEERIHAAIRPQIAYADRLIWELEFPQRINPGKHAA